MTNKNREKHDDMFKKIAVLEVDLAELTTKTMDGAWNGLRRLTFMMSKKKKNPKFSPRKKE